MVCPEELVERYRDLQTYLQWSTEDRDNVVALGPILQSRLSPLVEDFYEEVRRHPTASKVLTGDQDQIDRLKASLRAWLQQLFEGKYDLEYVHLRWRVGLRHAQIGLQQVYTNAALSRLRHGMHRSLREAGLPVERLWQLLESLDKLLDLDLAIIEDSYDSHRLQWEKLAERERSERKFRNLVEAAACMIVIMREDYRVVYFSPYAERLTGYRAADVEQRSFLDLFVVGESGEEAREDWLNSPAELPVNDVDLPIRCRDGSRRWLVWNAIQLDDFDGETAILAVGHDITEKRRSAERLLQAERLAAIGQTIAGLAHESRNALQRINSCTEMLEFEVEDNSEAMQLIRRSQQAQDDLTRLFDEVRNFAAPVSLELTRCPIVKVWREAWGLVQTDCRGRDVALQEHGATDDLALLADRFRLVQVFRNLFENSLAACQDPVRIDIVCQQLPASLAEPVNPRGARSAPPEAADDGGGERPNQWIEVRVRDNGPGLDPRRREVFEPFFTTKTKGTGLGMAIAHRILEAHGGSITVGDQGPCGAEFVLRLPQVNDDTISPNRRRR